MNNFTDNINNQSYLVEEKMGEFLTPEEFLQLASAKLAYLKALYRKQLGYDALVAAP
ncbi:hypothetical protein [Rufibacter tibetensis]|uniref:hypothetical protein n=1 Tax=Rufibacter tibetensis TaxID=512763 RepID=UPI000ABDAD9E|nr:hypothetical protein [Rufibacter tibetensis]